MEDAILLSTSPRRRGMETIKPVFFILSFAFGFALPRFTRLKCKRTRKCMRNKMKQFQWSCPVDYIKHIHHAQEENDHARIYYHFREKTQRLLLWLCTLSFPLSAPWHLFWMICFLFFFLPHPKQNSISGVYLSSGRGRQFSQPYIAEWAGSL